MGIILKKGKVYDINLGAIGYFYTGLKLVDASGAVLKLWDRNYEDSKGYHYVISNFKPTTTQRYYVVASNGEANTYLYTLRVNER